MTRSLGIIPARMGSTRFPAKVLTPILGKPMIQHVWNACSRSQIDTLVVATDDEQVVNAVRAFGGEAVLTPHAFESGTERVAWVARRYPHELVINIQGDEPLTDPNSINVLIHELTTRPNVDLATLCVRCAALGEGSNPNVVKVIRNESGLATSFSRNLDSIKDFFWKHIGIYAFRRESLFYFCSLPMTTQEKAERLEQLRALENGMRVSVVPMERDTIAVDVPSDVARVEMRMKEL